MANLKVGGAVILGESDEVLFRFSVISQVLTLIANGELRSKAIDQVAARGHFDGKGQCRRVTVRTIYRWLKEFDRKGSFGLQKRPRSKIETPSVLPKAFIEFLRTETEDDDEASIPELIKRAELYGFIKDRHKVCRQTVYRTCRRLGIPVCRKKKSQGRDTRRYAYPNRMLMVLCDGKHFRAGPQRLKRMIYTFLDDATRMALHAVCGTSECSELFLRGFYELITKYGLPSAVYLDKGPGFIASDTARVATALNIPFLFGETRYPEGHGKIEKLNQTVLKALLRSLAKPGIDPAPQALELRVQHYFANCYNHDPHSSLGRETPCLRFTHDDRALHFPESDHALRQAFQIPIERKVTADSVISFQSVLYEMPRGYARRWVTVYRHLLEGALGFIHEGRMITLHSPDLEKNARLKRAKTHKPKVKKVVKTAAELHFEKDFGPIVGLDGGFSYKD